MKERKKKKNENETYRDEGDLQAISMHITVVIIQFFRSSILKPILGGNSSS
jgi:hypothetical protein